MQCRESAHLVRVGHGVLVGIDYIPGAGGHHVGRAGVHNPPHAGRAAGREEPPRALGSEAVEGEEGPVAPGGGCRRRVHMEDGRGAGERGGESRGVGEVDGVVADEGGSQRWGRERGRVEDGDGRPAARGGERGGEVAAEEGGAAEGNGAGGLAWGRAGLGGRHRGWGGNGSVGRRWGTKRNGEGAQGFFVRVFSS